MIDCRRQFKLNVRPRCNVLGRLVHESSRVYSSSHYPIYFPHLCMYKVIMHALSQNMYLSKKM
jgi:hypothetical protein